MDWDHYRYFLALARKGSVTAAAAHHGVSHTTVSRRIAALEERLGCRLFEKLPSGYQLTPDGDEIVPYAEEMEQSAFALDRSVYGRDSKLRGEIRLNIPESILTPLLLPDICAFAAANPEIEIRLLVSDRVSNIQNREADIAVRLTDAPEEYLVGRRLTEIAYAVYGSYSGSQAEKWILWNHEDAPPGRHGAQFPGYRVGIRVDSMLSKVAAVKHGGGIAELPCFIGDADDGLVRLTPAEREHGWNIWVITHEDLIKTRRVRTLLDALYAAIECKADLILGRMEERSHPSMSM